MHRLKNEFTNQLVVLLAIMLPALIGSWIGGGGGFFIGLLIAAPIAIGVIRYIEGSFPGMNRSSVGK